MSLELPLSIIDRDPKLAVAPFPFEARMQFMEYIVSGSEKQELVKSSAIRKSSTGLPQI